MKSTKLHLLQTAALLAAVILLTVQADQLFPDSAEEDICTGESCDTSKQSQRGGSAAKGKGKGTEEAIKFKNIGYLSSGYDLIKGNPHSTKGFDPGFKANSLFKLTYDQGLVTPDGKYLIPDHCSASNQQICSFHFSTSTVAETGSYFLSLSSDAEVSLGGCGASFSASANYREIHEAIDGSFEDRFYATKAGCIVYSASITYSNAELNEDFRDSVLRLGTSIGDEGQYEALIDKFGTHFVSSMEMGGRYGYQSKISNENAINLAMEGRNVKAAAGYSGLVSVSLNSATDDQKEQAAAFNTARSSVEEFFVGEGPPPGSDNWTPGEWATKVAENPLPITYTLVHIENLFTRDYFPTDFEIDTKREILKKVFLAYCRRISIKPSFCDEENPDSTYLIPLLVLMPDAMLEVHPRTYAPIMQTVEFASGMMKSINEPFGNIIGNLRRAGSSRGPDWELSDMVRPAIGWINSTNSTDLMPVCPKGFFSISDFIPNPYLDPLQNTTLPCFAERCVKKCELKFLPTWKPPVYVYENGYPVLGGNYEENGYSYYRYPSDERPDEPDDMCLTYTCLDF